MYNVHMNKKRLKQLLAVLILVATVIAFVLYVRNHPETLRQLGKLPLTTFGLLLLLYGVFLGTLIWIQRATLSLCDISLERKENLLLVMYSSIINFFGPLQSGPAFRAAYLKKRHNVSLKNYTLATILQYAFYAAFSGLFMLTYFTGLWGLLGILFVIALTPILFRKPGLIPARFQKLKLEHVSSLAAAVLAQVSTFAVIFYVELNSLGEHVGTVPSLIYTGAANFALFVSVTPAAIGFRESFVIFTQQLHHITNPQIVTASLIDRGVYVLFLGVLIVIASSLHANQYLKSRAAEPRD